MNGAPETYRRFKKELFLQSASTSVSANRTESDSGYQSSSSNEVRSQSVTKSCPKRIPPLQPFALTVMDVSDDCKSSSQSLGSQTQRLSLRPERLSRLKIETFSNNHSTLQRRALQSESFDDCSKSIQNQCKISVSSLTPNSDSNSVPSTAQESTHSSILDSQHPHPPSEKCVCDSSATSSPSFQFDTESPAGERSDAKSDSRSGSLSDSSAARLSELSTEPDPVPNDIDSSRRPIKCSYRRFDSRKLINPISLPSVHPAAQKRSVMHPLPLREMSFERGAALKQNGKIRSNSIPETTTTATIISSDVESSLPGSCELLSKTNNADSLPHGVLSSSYAAHAHSPGLQAAQTPGLGLRSFSRPDSLGGFNYVESRQNTRRAKRNANEKKRQERELLICDFYSKLSGEEAMGTFDALFKLSFNGAQDWIKSNLVSAVEKVSNPVKFALKLMEFWFMRSGQRHSPSHERALGWLLNPLASFLLQLCERRFTELSVEDSEEDAHYVRQKIRTLGPGLPAQIWANLINLLELPIPEEELLGKTRELLTNIGRLDDVYVFVKELSLQSSLPFEELFVPLIRTKHYKWAVELAHGNPVLLHQLVMGVFPQDAKQSLRIILDCSMDVTAYSQIEIAAKIPELETIMHQGILIEFAQLICCENIDLQAELLKLALKSGHRSDFDALCSLFSLTLDDLDFDVDTTIPEECYICLQNKKEVMDVGLGYLSLPVECIFEPSDDVLEYVVLSSSLIAIDLEFRPHFCQFCQADTERAAILQLATPTCCLVLDLMRPLGECRLEVLRMFLESPDILKLGFGIENDLRMLVNTLMDPNLTKLQSVLDLQKVAAIICPPQSSKIALSTICRGLFHDLGSFFGLGLTQACESILGLQVDKTEQVSNWERRPLRESQIMYAAIDAYSLILLADKILEDSLILESIPRNDAECIPDNDFSVLLSMTEKAVPFPEQKAERLFSA